MSTASTFAGGFDLSSLCAVAGTVDEVEVLGHLDSLVRKSLVVAHHGASRTRYSLYETIRAFAADRLSEPERAALRERHAAHFATEAAARWERWNGPAGGTRWTGWASSSPTCGPRSTRVATAATWCWRPTSPPTRP